MRYSRWPMWKAANKRMGNINVDISFNHDKYMHIVYIQVKLWLNRPALDFWIISLNWFPTGKVSPLVSVF